MAFNALFAAGVVAVAALRLCGTLRKYAEHHNTPPRKINAEIVSQGLVKGAFPPVAQGGIFNGVEQVMEGEARFRL